MPSLAIECIACLWEMTQSDFEMILSLSIPPVREFSDINKYFNPSEPVGLLPCHWQSCACQRSLWNKLVSGKEQPSPQKPLSIPIKLHCYAFNKGSLKTTLML